MTSSQEERSLIEQHIGTVLQVLVVALLGWSLSTTMTMTKDVEVLKVQVTALTTAVNQGTNDRYRGTDAAKDFAALRAELAKDSLLLREELVRVDRRVSKLEDKVLK
jgi:hypothetical protein